MAQQQIIVPAESTEDFEALEFAYSIAENLKAQGKAGVEVLNNTGSSMRVVYDE